MSDSSEEEIVLENTEITNPPPAEVETITRAKKPRSQKQIEALEKARKARAEKIAEKKKMKSAEQKLIEDNYEFLKASALGGTGGNVELNVEDNPEVEEEEVEETPPPILRKAKETKTKSKKKKVKKVIVNNYYEPEESSDEEMIEEQNNFYIAGRKKGRKNVPPPNPNTQQYLDNENVEYEEEIVANNNYTFNPYGNITFC